MTVLIARPHTLARLKTFPPGVFSETGSYRIPRTCTPFCNPFATDVPLPVAVPGLLVSGTVARTNKQRMQVNAVRPATRDLMVYIPN